MSSRSLTALQPTAVWSEPSKLIGASRQYALVLVVTALAVAMSVVAFLVVRGWQSRQVVAEFDQHASGHAAALQETVRSVRSDLEVVHSLGSLFAAAAGVSRGDFRTFVKPALARHPVIQALEWIPRVPDSQRVAYEHAVGQNGFPDFRIVERDSQGLMVPAAERDEYFPVYYVEPYRGNEAALGFDLASSPTRMEALCRSRDDGEMVATARITLVQETSDQFGFLAFLPVYQGGETPPRIAERRERLRGLVLGVFRVGDIVDGSFSRAGASGDALLYSSAAADQPRSPPRFAEAFGVGGRTWDLLRTRGASGRNFSRAGVPPR